MKPSSDMPSLVWDEALPHLDGQVWDALTRLAGALKFKMLSVSPVKAPRARVLFNLVNQSCSSPNSQFRAVPSDSCSSRGAIPRVATFMSAFESCSFLQPVLLFLVATTSGLSCQTESKAEDDKCIQEIQVVAYNSSLTATKSTSHQKWNIMI